MNIFTLVIDHSCLGSYFTLTVYSIKGEEVIPPIQDRKTQQVLTQTLNLGHLPKGTYLLKIQLGNRVGEKRLILK